MTIYESATQPSDVHRNDTLSPPEMSEYLLAMRHELRAPLNAIIGMSALLLDDDVSPRQAHYVKSVHAAGESLSVILNDVLDLASVAANRLAIEPIPFDLKSMIEETANALTPKANERGLALRVDWRPELPRYLVGDPGRTRQVIGNLVGYAVNGTTHGEVVIRVTADGERSGIPAIRFSVEDTGVGIAPGRLARIFDEYVPLDASPYRSFGVTGLGLRLSAELVRLMGGVIHAESEPGRGNRLWFSIPMPTAAQYETGVGSEPIEAGGGRALIVEADFSNRSRFAQQFQDAGWRVEFTAEIETVGAQLRQAMADGDPYRTCIISHYAVRPIHMELARDLKADSLVAPVALVMVTAVGSPGDGQKLWNAGFAAYLRKPVPAEEIRESLDALSRLGATGKGNSLITRHSLAEIRNAQSFEVEGIDEMLASLTAPTDSATSEIEADAPTSEVSSENLIDSTPAEPSLTPAENTVAADSDLPTIAAPVVPLPPALESLLALPLPGSVDEPIVAPDSPALVSSIADAAEREPVNEPAPEPVALIGPAVPPVEASVPEPTLFHTELDVLAPPAIAPVTDAADAAVEASEAAALDTQLALEVEHTEFETASEPDASLEEASAAATTPPDAEPAQTLEPESLAIEQSVVATIEAAVDADEPDPVLVDEPAPQLSASLIDGHQDALWESEPAVPALDGLVVRADEGIDSPSAVIESVTLTSPGDYLVTEPSQQEAIEPATVDPVATAAHVDLAQDLIEPSATVEPQVIEAAPGIIEVPAVAEAAGAVDLATVHNGADSSFAVMHGATEAAESADAVREGTDAPIESILDDNEGHSFAGAPPEPVADPDLEPEPELDVSTFDVVSPQLLDGLSTGGSFFTQHLVTAFLRDGSAEVERLTTARGEQVSDALGKLALAAEWVGAARLSALVADAATRVERTGRAGSTARIAAALAEARTTLELASPLGLPAELAAVGATFAEQLSPAQEGSGRLLAVTLATTFASEAPVRASELRDAVAQGNTDTAQRLAQTLKGMCGLIGAEPLAKLAALVEADARLKRLGQTERYLTHIDRELARVRAFLDQARG